MKNTPLTKTTTQSTTAAERHQSVLTQSTQLSLRKCHEIFLAKDNSHLTIATLHLVCTILALNEHQSRRASHTLHISKMETLFHLRPTKALTQDNIMIDLEEIGLDRWHHIAPSSRTDLIGRVLHIILIVASMIRMAEERVSISRIVDLR
jgi:hypothetical protein